jgi:hypothetical protein
MAAAWKVRRNKHLIRGQQLDTWLFPYRFQGNYGRAVKKSEPYTHPYNYNLSAVNQCFTPNQPRTTTTAVTDSTHNRKKEKLSIEYPIDHQVHNIHLQL